MKKLFIGLCLLASGSIFASVNLSATVSVVNTATSFSSVELINSGVLVNSIIVGDPSSEVRPNNSNNFISSNAWEEYSTSGTSTINGTNNIAGKTVNNFYFVNPTSFAGVMIPDYTTPFDQAKYNEICKANFKIAVSTSDATTIPSLKVLPASYTYSSSIITLTATIPAQDLLGINRPITSNGHLDLGAYQFSSFQSAVNYVADNFKKIYAVNESIVIEGAGGQIAAIYNISGQIVNNVAVTSDIVSIPSTKGFYFVRVGLSAVKVLVR